MAGPERFVPSASVRGRAGAPRASPGPLPRPPLRPASAKDVRLVTAEQRAPVRADQSLDRTGSSSMLKWRRIGDWLVMR